MRADKLLDDAVSGMDYWATVQAYIRFVGKERSDDLGARDRDLVSRFMHLCVGLNQWFARKLATLTDDLASERLAWLSEDFDDMFEIVLVSGWASKLVELCVRDRWWKTLGCVVTMYDLENRGRHVDPRIPELLDQAHQKGFERTIFF